MKYLFKLVVLLIIISACNEIDEVKKNIYGYWVVDSVCVNGREKSEPYFMLNILTFKENMECHLPKLIGNNENQAIWEIEKKGNNTVLLISGASSGYYMFNGIYSIKYSDINNEVDQIVLNSDDLILVCKRPNV